MVWLNASDAQKERPQYGASISSSRPKFQLNPLIPLVSLVPECPSFYEFIAEVDRNFCFKLQVYLWSTIDLFPYQNLKPPKWTKCLPVPAIISSSRSSFWSPSVPVCTEVDRYFCFKTINISMVYNLVISLSEFLTTEIQNVFLFLQ